ncbi:MAG: 3-dehydroquinate synthase [Bacteroidia bacterium]
MKEYNLKKVSIYIGTDVFGQLTETLINHSYSKVFVLVDEITEKLCYPLLQKHLFELKLIQISSGEKNKNTITTQFIWTELQKHNADRNSVLLNLGGGMITDIGGFSASTYKRGIDFINIPTTLLGMVDASIGGKTGIDFNGVKNMVGLFSNPVSVYIFPDFLQSLPKTELINGFAEVIKHALIADPVLWQNLSEITTDDFQKIISLIAPSVKIKIKVVKKDPQEKSLRKILNFGHTLGHAIESYSLENDSKPLKHGEAVAIGMICEAFLSREILNLSKEELNVISRYILKFFPKYPIQSVLSPEVIKFVYHDKKNISESFNFTLLKRIGKASINHSCTELQITRALNYYESL